MVMYVSIFSSPFEPSCLLVKPSLMVMELPGLNPCFTARCESHGMLWLCGKSWTPWVSLQKQLTLSFKEIEILWSSLSKRVETIQTGFRVSGILEPLTTQPRLSIPLDDAMGDTPPRLVRSSDRQIWSVRQMCERAEFVPMQPRRPRAAFQDLGY